MKTDIVLKRGTNVITFATYGYAGLDEPLPDTSAEAGGRNITYMLVDTTADITAVVPSTEA